MYLHRMANHAIQAFGAMRMGKHVYLQKPIAHDIYEARILTEAAKKYKVVTQMGDQGNSCDGMRTLREWFEADLLGDIQKVYCWTNRPAYGRKVFLGRTRNRLFLGVLELGFMVRNSGVCRLCG